MQSKILPGEEALALALQSARNRENPRWILAGEAERDDEGNATRDPDDLDEEDLPPIDELLAQAARISVPDWFRQQRSQRIEDAEGAYDEAELLGKWPRQPEDKGGFTLHRDIVTGRVFDEAALFAVEAPASWQILARWPFGGWNDCPQPDEHAAVWKYWEERYDAHVIGVSRDVVEAIVLRPPRTREAALELAWEHYAYCSDIVDQETQTICRLADALLDFDHWFFWWD